MFLLPDSVTVKHDWMEIVIFKAIYFVYSMERVCYYEVHNSVRYHLCGSIVACQLNAVMNERFQELEIVSLEANYVKSDRSN
jgi:hypothetical protein